MWKNKAYCHLSLFFVLFSITSCQKNSVDWINSDAWRKDYNGCSGYRMSLLPVLDKRKEEFLNKDDVFFFHGLGKPNRVSYSERGRKSFYYYLTPGEQCTPQTGKTQCLIIEFEALGSARMIYLRSL